MKAYQQGEQPDPIEHVYMEGLNSSDPGERYQAVRNIRNMLIGMKSKKISFIEMGLIEKLIDLMVEEDTTVEFAVEGAVVLGSLARGDSETLQHVLDSQVVPILCKGICHHDGRLVDACLRSLRICFISNQVPADLIYEDANIVSNLVQLLKKSPQTAECAANILQRSCKTANDQSMLYDAGVLQALSPWLEHKQPAILVPVLGCLSALVYFNEVVANKLFECTISGITIKEQLVKLISRDKPDEVQLEAATCITKMLRASSDISAVEPLERKILTVFVRLCHKEKPYKVRISAANGLAYLIEDDNELQAIAAISNHLIKNISIYFNVVDDMDRVTTEKLRENAFKVYAALSANDEKIRKQIVDSTPDLISNIHEAINQEVNAALLAAALQCLLSLSRSVQQLRTTFQDVKLWEPVISALKSSTSDDVISVASSVLCNLLLDFSPCKESLVECGALEVLIALMKRSEVPFRVNGVWGLMNLAYDADDALKNKIVEVVGMQNILSLLDDTHVDIAVKALGILRNLLTEKEQDIDNLMKNYGPLIMTSIKHLVLENNLSEKLKEQVLCLLSNIANGNYAKDILISEEEIIMKIIGYITSDCEQLQIACVFCITNLMRTGDEMALERQRKLRELGAEKQLQTLLTTSNANLFDRVKIALQQFT